jgi:hypothetical protein
LLVLADLPQLHSPMAAVYLHAVMMNPRAEPSKHREMVEAVKLDVYRNLLRKQQEQKEIPNTHMRALVDAALGPRIKDTVPKNLISPNYKVIRPEVAVQIFLFVLAWSDAKDPAEPATLEYARKVIGDGRPGLGRSELIEIWQDFAPAVHLLAVQIMWRPLWDLCGRSATALAKFLAYAEAFRIRGEHHKPPRSKGPLLDPAETWRLPDWVALPDLDEALAFPHPARLKALISTWTAAAP